LEPIFQVISVSKPRDSIEITNREAEAVSSCVVSIPDRWKACLPTLAPLETTSVRWVHFRSDVGNEMPPHMGQNDRYSSTQA
jgi:hypothetical protein